jgi:hypothetical protein
LTPLRSARVELGVRRLLLVQVGREETHDVVVTEFFSPRDQRPATAHFVVLDGLRVRDDGGVQHCLILDFASCLVGLLIDAVDRRTLRPAGLLAELLEDLLKPLDLLVGLFQMALQSRDQIAVGRLLDHLGQPFNDLLPGVTDILQTMDLHRYDGRPPESRHSDVRKSAGREAPRRRDRPALLRTLCSLDKSPSPHRSGRGTYAGPDNR